MTPSGRTWLDPRSITLWGIAGVLLLALGARTGVAALSPLAATVELDVPLSGLWLGLLGTIPPLAYALSGVFTPRLARALSLEGLAVLVSIITALAHVARGFTPHYLGLFVATIALMLGVGSINVILPGLVKLYAPTRIGQVTSLYSTAMALSTALPAGVGLWLAEAFDWRWSLASWALLSVAAMVPWLVLLRFAWNRRAEEAAALSELPELPSLGVLWKSPTARAIALIFSISGLTAYSVFALLPPVLVDQAGATPVDAAWALTLFALTGIPMSLIIPLLAVRKGWPSRLVVLAAGSGVSGFLGLALVPQVAPLLWTVLTALGTLSFSMALALIGQRTVTHQMATNLSGFVNTVGYLVAGVGPVLTGLLRELTGEWTASLFVLAALSLLALPAAAVFARENTVESELPSAP